MAEWYVHQNGRQTGPYTSAQLKEMADAGKLSPDDLVTRIGGTEWQHAKQIKGLFPSPVTVQPQLPPLPPRVSQQVVPVLSPQSTPGLGTKPRSWWKLVALILGVVVGSGFLVCLGLVSLLLFSNSPTVVVSSLELTREFRKDMIQADRKYNGKYIEVVGKIRRIDTTT